MTDAVLPATALSQAIDAWRALLGDEHVDTSSAALSAASTTTFATRAFLPAILRPADVAQVQGILRIASWCGVPVYPVSGGRNWGLGSRAPVRGGCALLDLGRLNRIVDFDERLGYVTVEPGVTFSQLHAFLTDQRSSLFLPAIGGSPHASIIGNTVERGEGIGPGGDRMAASCAMEVVLPSGELLRTGYGRFARASATPVHRWGVGPSLDGLFAQSNLGVVTRLTVWLTPRPAFFQLFTAGVSDAARIPAFVDAAQRLAMHDVLPPATLAFWNAYKLLARDAQYPWAATGGATPLGPSAIAGVHHWIACGGLYGASRAHGAADRALVEDALAPHVDALQFIDQDTHPAIVEDSMMIGVPSEMNVRSAYWRKRSPFPTGTLDPDRDGCGMLWLCHALPFDGHHVRDVVQLSERVVLEDGFEPNIAAVHPSARCLHLFVAITYDRDLPGEDERAMRCHDRLFADLMAEGHLPYRLGIQQMESLPPTDATHAAFVAALRSQLDPKGILAPGRYER